MLHGQCQYNALPVSLWVSGVNASKGKAYSIKHPTSIVVSHSKGFLALLAQFVKIGQGMYCLVQSARKSTQ
jgi:hypothetical protein